MLYTGISDYIKLTCVIQNKVNCVINPNSCVTHLLRDVREAHYTCCRRHICNPSSLIKDCFLQGNITSPNYSIYLHVLGQLFPEASTTAFISNVSNWLDPISIALSLPEKTWQEKLSNMEYNIGFFFSTRTSHLLSSPPLLNLSPPSYPPHAALIPSPQLTVLPNPSKWHYQFLQPSNGYSKPLMQSVTYLILLRRVTFT